MKPAASGAQWTITHGDLSATVTEVGGGLRTFTRDGIDLVAGYRADEPAPHVRGHQLMPWPNRIRDGRYTDGGHVQQLPIDEVEYHNASHGLVRWALWSLAERTPDSLTVTYRLHPSQGWAHHLDLRTTYTLGDAGLRVTTRARNVGASVAPFGYGGHPYLSIGSMPPTSARLHVPAARWLAVDERMLPTNESAVDGTALDFRRERELGDGVVDHAFTGLQRDSDGCWRITVTGSVGPISLWADESFDWAQVFTGAAHHGLGEPGIAVEPLTCPAEAFNSGVGLLRLAPGEQWTGTWGISAR